MMGFFSSPKSADESQQQQQQQTEETFDSPNDDDNDSDSNVDDLLQSPLSSNSKLRLELHRASSPPTVQRMVSFTGLPEPVPPSPIVDEEKTRKQLLLKVQQLKEMLKEAEFDISAEKTLRKKKDRNLMKLAKELKKRNRKSDEDAQTMQTLDVSLKNAQQELALVRKELEQQKVLNEKHLEDSRREFERALTDAHNKYAKTCSEHDARITELSNSHARQCEELCREILKSNVEADQLQSKLGGKKGILKNRTAVPFEPAPSRVKVVMDTIWTIFRRIIYAIILLAFAIFKGFLPMGAICAPARPGLVLKDKMAGTVSYEAPWWAPQPIKDNAFAYICNGADRSHSPTRLDWIYDAYENKVIITHLGRVVLNKRAEVAEIRANSVRIWNRRGNGEQHQSLWR